MSPMKDLVNTVKAKIKFQMTVTDPEGEQLTPPDDKSERGGERGMEGWEGVNEGMVREGVNEGTGWEGEVKKSF